MNDGGSMAAQAAEAAAPAAWRLRLHGPAQLLAPHGAVFALDRLAALIAARLALAGPQPRELLARQLWPDAHEARARGNLRQRLLRLKAQAGWAWIDGTSQLRLHPLVQFDTHAAGTLLEGLPHPADDELADWLDMQRRAAARGQAQALQQQLAQAEATEQWDEAFAVAERMVALDPGAENPRRTLARLHYLNHDHGSARAELEQLRLTLLRHHGAVPSAASEQLRSLVERASTAQGSLAGATASASFGAFTGTAAGLAPDLARALSPALQRPPHMIGREAELQCAHRVLAECGALLLLGEAGLGKSRLLAEVVAGRADVLAVKAQAGDAGVPYATLSRLLRKQLALGRVPDAPPAVGQVLSRLLPEMQVQGAADAPPADGSRRLLQDAVQALLVARGQAAIVVDDLHFADAASLEMLAALVLAEPLAHLAWLFAQRPDGQGDAARAFSDKLIDTGRLQPLRLGPLDAPAVSMLLHSLSLPALDAQAWASRLLRHTGGNPMFILETLKQLQSGDLAAGRLPASGTVGALLDRRLKALSADALALARLAAVAGADFSPALAESVTGRGALALADAWAELEAALVLRESSFAHDLVGEAALRSLPHALAEHLHGTVAEWLQSQAAEPARVAGHWLAARRPEQAAPWLASAADQARHQLRPREEAAFLEQLVEATQHGDPPLAMRTLLRLARVLIEAEGVSAPSAALQRALQLARHDGERVQVLNQVAEMEFNRMLPLSSADAAQQAVALADALGDLGAKAEAVLRWHRALCASGQAHKGEQVWQAHAHEFAGVELASAELLSDRGWMLDRLGRVREARAWHQRALQRARSAGRPVDEAVVLGNVAQSFWLSGEPAAADSALDSAYALSERHEGLHGASDYLAAYRGMVATELARFTSAARYYEQAQVHAADQSPQARLALLARRAMLWVAIGQRGRALADAAAVLAEPALPTWATAMAHCALAHSAQAVGGSAAPGLQRAIDALGDDAQLALREPIRLKLQLAAAQDDPRLARDALASARQALRQARGLGHPGLRWAAHWVAAQLALLACRPVAARRHALACAARPAGVVPLHLGDGLWWHGLWQVWSGLGDTGRAETARAEGVAWIHRSVQRELAAEFHASFRDAVVAHRELLAGEFLR